MLAGIQQLTAQVSPGRPVEPNLSAVITTTFAASGSLASCLRIEQVAGQRLDAVLFEPGRQLADC